jgi:hypothetical protein
VIEVRAVSGCKKGMRDFLEFPYALYKQDPHWVAPLRFERKEFFNPQKNPFFDEAKVEFFVAYQNHVPVGRITAHSDLKYSRTHGDREGFFGFYEAMDDLGVCQALVDRAEKFVREQGHRHILGPFNFSTNHEIGFLKEGFDLPPVVMTTYTKPYYLDHFTRLGYHQEKILYAWWLENVETVPPVALHTFEKVSQKYGDRLLIRNLNFKKLPDDLKIVIDIFNDAWKENWGFNPLSDKELKKMAEELKLIADPRITYLLYKDGEPAACLLGIPDINEVLSTNRSGRLFPTGIFKLLFGRKKIRTVRVVIMGVKQKFRRLGLDMVMIYHVFNDGLKKTNYRNTEMSWILEDNQPMNSALERLGAKLYKKHVIFGKTLAAQPTPAEI